MTLTERIAKRKAEGWSVHFIIKKGDETLDADGYFWSRDDGYAWERYLTIKDAKASLGELDAPHNARIVPVFTRTIKRPRAYSFWQACKMVMAGKKMRRVDAPSGYILLRNGFLQWYHGEDLVVTELNVGARWELAE